MYTLVLLAQQYSTKNFDTDMLENLMSPEYQLYIIKNDCADVGHFGMARTRTYIIMRHVETTDCLYDPVEMYQEIKEYIRSRVQTRPSDYMIATPEEVALEAQHVSRVRMVPYVPGNMDLTYLLNEREKKTLDAACAQYRKRFSKDPFEDQNLAIFLGDSHTYGITWSAVSNRIPTFRLNTGMMFFPFYRRWMCSSEKLAAFGFPIRDVATTMGCPPLLIRDWKRANQLAGNCMVLPCIAIVQMVALSCIASKSATGSMY